MSVISNTLLKKIQRIKIQTTHLANTLLAGTYKSAFKGKGMEFEEVREYVEGDDSRNIDWNVTARMNHPFVKTFREERELTVTLAVDVSFSTHFGSGERLKSDLIAEIAAVIAFSAIKNNDKVALILFSDRVEKYLPPKKGVKHVLRIIRELLTYQAERKGTSIGEALSFLGSVQRRGSLCFLLSDFMNSDFNKEAAVIIRKHDLVPIAIVDKSEMSFPKMGLVSFFDREIGGFNLIDTSSQEVQADLKKSTGANLSFHEKNLIKLGIKLCVIQSDKPFGPQLKKYFSIRNKGLR